MTRRRLRGATEKPPVQRRTDDVQRPGDQARRAELTGGEQPPAHARSDGASGAAASVITTTNKRSTKLSVPYHASLAPRCFTKNTLKYGTTKFPPNRMNPSAITNCATTARIAGRLSTRTIDRIDSAMPF